MASSCIVDEEVRVGRSGRTLVVSGDRHAVYSVGLTLECRREVLHRESKSLRTRADTRGDNLARLRAPLSRAGRA